MPLIASESITAEADSGKSFQDHAAEAAERADMEANRLWLRVCEDIRRFLGRETFNTWIGGLQLSTDGEGGIVLCAASEFERDRLRDNYLKIIDLHWRKHDPKRRSVRIELVSSVRREECGISGQDSVSGGEDLRSGDSRMNFQSLVRGPSNDLAIGIAHRLVKGKGVSPLSLVLFHGPNGVGKTHVMQAIAQERSLCQENSGTLYMSAEEFMLAFVEGVQRGSTREMRLRIRRSHMLLLDDIHLLKPGSLREFFSHVRAIVSMGGQVIMTSDSPPESMQLLDARMRDEVQGGVRVPIARPDAAMRMEIARIKWRHIAEDFPQFSMSEDWISLLAEKLPASGRAVDGAVRSIFASTVLVGKSVTLEAVLAPIRNEKSVRRPKVETIKEVVAESFGVNRVDMESADRRRAVSVPRQVAMYIARKMTSCSYPQIGRLFGGKDHTTVIYACDKIAKKIETDSELAARVRELEASCSEAGLHSR